MGHETETQARLFSALNGPLEADSSNQKVKHPLNQDPQFPDTSGTAVLNLLVSFYSGLITCGLEQEKAVFLSQPQQELGTASYLFSHFLIQHGNRIGPDGCCWQDWQACISGCLYLGVSPGILS